MTLFVKYDKISEVNFYFCFMQLFRVENPNIPANPNSITSHESLVGSWFSSDLNYVTSYLSKNQRMRIWKVMEKVQWLQLIILNVPEKDLEIYRAQVHPIASGMDIEPDNFIIPQEQRESFQEMRMSLDDLEMVWWNFIKLRMARDEIKRRLKDLGILES